METPLRKTSYHQPLAFICTCIGKNVCTSHTHTHRRKHAQDQARKEEERRHSKFWCMCVIPELRRLKQENLKFETSLDYTKLLSQKRKILKGWG